MLIKFIFSTFILLNFLRRVYRSLLVLELDHSRGVIPPKRAVPQPVPSLAWVGEIIFNLAPCFTGVGRVLPLMDHFPTIQPCYHFTHKYIRVCVCARARVCVCARVCVKFTNIYLCKFILFIYVKNILHIFLHCGCVFLIKF